MAKTASGTPVPNEGYMPGHPGKYVVFMIYKFDEINCDMRFFLILMLA
jgi:hypothetical protein